MIASLNGFWTPFVDHINITKFVRVKKIKIIRHFKDFQGMYIGKFKDLLKRRCVSYCAALISNNDKFETGLFAVEIYLR